MRNKKYYVSLQCQKERSIIIKIQKNENYYN
nr:MAG TPA: hypothetical protein [Caudoviricetes sp.]DAS61395.1 MAG TPA: hypothetical protein [Caudoviricetes sp.]